MISYFYSITHHEIINGKTNVYETAWAYSVSALPKKPIVHLGVVHCAQRNISFLPKHIISHCCIIRHTCP